MKNLGIENKGTNMKALLDGEKIVDIAVIYKVSRNVVYKIKYKI